MKGSSKLSRYCLREAKKEIAQAKRRASDPNWISRASGMSIKWAREVSATPEQVRAEYHRRYLTYRACLYHPAVGWTDRAAREEYKRAAGKYPSCPRANRT